MITFRQEPTHGTHTSLRSIGQQWSKRNRQQLNILGIGAKCCGLEANFHQMQG